MPLRLPLALPLLALSCAGPRAVAPDVEGTSLASLEAAAARPVETLALPTPRDRLFTNAHILTALEDIPSGYLLVRKGRIEALGAGEAPDPGDTVEVIDLDGAFVTPGLIDTHSHLGVYPSPHARAHSDGNEATSPTTGGVWAEHSFWPQDPGIARAIAGGVTTLQALPGSANLVGGRGATLHLLPARGSRAMRFPDAPQTLKMACGENPKRVYGGRNGAPSTRMGNLRGQRQAFATAARLRESWSRYQAEIEGGDEDARAPERDLDTETLVGVLEGWVLPQIHCYRADDMLSILQLADEFGFEVRSFHHALEAYKIRDILAERGVASSTWADWWGFKLEAYDGIPQNAALLTESGARAIIHSDSSIGIQRLNQEAAKAFYAGVHAGVEVDEVEALRWITANPAWALGIEDEVGTLEPGKRADLAIWSAHPFSVYSRAEAVYVDGLLVYEAGRDHAPWSDFLLGQEQP